MTETIEAANTQIAEYSATTAGLAELAHRLRGRAYDCTTVKGGAEARADRMECVKLRTGLEAKRKEIKEPALERCRLIDAEAKRITSAIIELESPIDAQIKADETRREQERKRKAEENASRIHALHARIQQITDVAMSAVGMSADDIEKRMDFISRLEIGADFDELRPEAEKAQITTVSKLRELLAAQMEAEAQLERDKLKAAADERARQERAAEQSRLDAIAAEQRRIAEEIAAAERAEANRIADAARAEADLLAANERALREAELRRREDEALERRAAEIAKEADEKERMNRLHARTTMTNNQLIAAWKRKLPGVEPTDREMAAFALGVEVAEASSERRAIMFGDMMHHQILAMRAAVVDGHLRSPKHGLQWIVNTLGGPGHLPNLDEARALGGAQAMFDKELAEQEAFRTAHPAPGA